VARILIADDHVEARRGARRLLEEHSGWEVCGEAENGLEAIEKAARLKPDIVILDLSMPKMSGLDAARVIHSAAPQIPLLLFSLYAGDPQMTAGIRGAGFSGDVNKAAAHQLIAAIETLLQGGTYFTSAAVPAVIVADESAARTDQSPAKAPSAPSATPQASAASGPDGCSAQPPAKPSDNNSEAS
jgi:DNA-binding NarL/FixJ family response regulator